MSESFLFFTDTYDQAMIYCKKVERGLKYALSSASETENNGKADAIKHAIIRSQLKAREAGMNEKYQGLLL